MSFEIEDGLIYGEEYGDDMIVEDLDEMDNISSDFIDVLKELHEQ